MEAWLRQYCINVTDLDRTVAFYEAIGLENTSRTALPEANIDEAMIENPAKGGRIQLAAWHDRGPIEMGNAFWKLYIYTNDAERIYKEAIDFGCESVMEPLKTDRWPMIVGFVKDPDGYLVEFCQRVPGQGDDLTTRAWVNQHCLNVTDIETTIKFYEAMGLVCTSRTSITGAEEAILQHAEGKGGNLVQLAQHYDHAGPIDMGTAIWKLYVYTDDCPGLYDKLVGTGYTSVAEPRRTPRWPTTIAFVADPDNYQIELVQLHES
jgi:catechol 2,3-dioxygenase-like lactoylglutathione lyase family enzyme